jgi:hypothetical protein
VKQASQASATVSPARITGMSQAVRARTKAKARKAMGYGSKIK